MDISEQPLLFGEAGGFALLPLLGQQTGIGFPREAEDHGEDGGRDRASRSGQLDVSPG